MSKHTNDDKAKTGRTARPSRRLLQRGEPRRYGAIPADDAERRDLLAILAVRGAPVMRADGVESTCGSCKHRSIARRPDEPPERCLACGGPDLTQRPVVGMAPSTAFVRAANVYLARHEGFCYQFARRRGARHVPIEDVVQACRIGALIALERFDPAKAGRFLSYARWWMRCETGKLLHHTEALVPVPATVKKERERLVAEAPADVSDEEAAQVTGLPLDNVRIARRLHLGNEHRAVDERARSQRRSWDEARRERAVRLAELTEDAHLAEALGQLSAVQRRILYDEFGVGEPVDAPTPKTDAGRRALRHAALRRLRAILLVLRDPDDAETALCDS